MKKMIGISAIVVAMMLQSLPITAAEQTYTMNAANFEQVTIVDDENCTVTITGVDADSIWGYTWQVYLENKTDMELMFSVNDVAVNGFMCDPFWATSVAAGKKANEEIVWMEGTFEENGIDTVEEVVFTLSVYDSNDWMADHLVESTYAVETVEQNEEQVSAGEAVNVSEETVSPVTESETAEEIVIVDDGNCVFVITDINEDGDWGYTWNVYMENNTDKDLMYSLNDMSVNGFVCDPFWAAEISAGMKANEEIVWMADSFEKNGITEVTDIEGVLSVYDTNDWMADHLVDELFTVYPNGEEAVVPYERTAVEGEIVLADNEACSVIVTGYDPDGFMGYTMNVYLENKTESKLMFSMDEVSVNGFMCDPFWAAEVPAGKRSNEEVQWFSDDFEANGITDVECIEGMLKVRNAEDYSVDAYVNEAFSLTP